MNPAEQLAAIRRLHLRFDAGGIAYWLFGGWAVDFHAGRVTRPHADIDLAVYQADLAGVQAVLADDGWTHTPEPDEDGYTVYRHGDTHLDLAFLARDGDGTIYTPARAGRGEWPANSFPGDLVSLGDVTARVVGLRSLIADKSVPREDVSASAKDRADVVVLTGLDDRP